MIKESELLTRVLLALIAIGSLPPTAQAVPGTAPGAAADTADVLPVYGYEVINIFPHETDAFTQGLVYNGGFLYEGTGLNGGSQLRKVVLETGEVVKRHPLSSAYFGEGITIYDDKIYQLTWRNRTGFVYVEHDEFELIDTFSYGYPGCGLTHDDTSLIMSDGTDKLYHLDPETYEEIRRFHVTANGSPIHRLNELELIQGRIYANILDQDVIAIIDPATGEVTGWLDLAGILPEEDSAMFPGPLNGIAFDPDSIRLFVTGKKWPSLFEIRVAPIHNPPQPEGIRLAQNRPNPFGETTAVEVAIGGEPGSSRRVRLAIYDVAGRHVETLIDQDLSPGVHPASWDGRNRSGEYVSAGVYFCVLSAGDTMLTRKMVRLK